MKTNLQRNSSCYELLVLFLLSLSLCITISQNIRIWKKDKPSICVSIWFEKSFEIERKQYKRYENHIFPQAQFL